MKRSRFIVLVAVLGTCSLLGSYVGLAWHAPAIWKRANRSNNASETKLLMTTFRWVAPLYERITEHRWEQLMSRDRSLRTRLKEALRSNPTEFDKLKAEFFEHRKEVETLKSNYYGCMAVHRAPIQGRLNLDE